MIFINAHICTQMPYYPRYRRRTGFARYRRRYGYRRRRYARRSTTAGSLSSRSRVRVRVQSEQLVTLTIPAKGLNSNVATSVPFADYAAVKAPGSLNCAAVTSPLYQAYTKLFDQVKCDGVISKIAVTTPVGSSNSAVPALQIVTAYDRNGNFREATQTDLNSQGAYAASPVTYDEVLEASGSVVRSALNNSVAKLARSCWASDIQERTTFHDCSLEEHIDGFHNDAAYVSSDRNATFFSPLLYVAFHLPTTAPQTKLDINFILSQTYYFTFRNPKYGASSGASSTASAAVRARDDPLAVQSLDAEERVFTREKSGYTPPRKQARSSVAAMMEAGLDDPEDVTPHLLESLAERQEAMDDPDYVGNPKGILDRFDDESERTDLQINLRRGKKDADRWHARHDGETSLLSLPRGTTRVIPPSKK